MRVLIALNDISGNGGVERVVTNISNKFIEDSKYNIEILNVFKSKKEEILFDLNKEVKIHDLKEVGREKLKNYYLKFKTIEKLLLNNSFDIVLGCSVFINLLIFCVMLKNKKQLKKMKLIAWEHSQYKNSYKVFIFLRKIFYPFLHGVVTLTKSDNEIFCKFCKNSQVIYNIRPYEVTEYSDLENKKIISVGRLEEEKGFDMLLKAFKEVRESGLDWKLEIYGEGSKKYELEELIAKLKLEKNVTLKGFYKNIGEKYKEASLYVMSSKTESFGMVLVEAMGYGLPCISFDCEVGPREIITNKKDGILIEKDNIKELANAMIFLIEKDNIRKNYGKNAVLKNKEFSKNKILKKWDFLFNKK